jgi:hypothetical protein
MSRSNTYPDKKESSQWHMHHVLKDLNRTYRDQIPSIWSEIFVGSKAVQKGFARGVIHRWDMGEWSGACDQVGDWGAGLNTIYLGQITKLRLQNYLFYLVLPYLAGIRYDSIFPHDGIRICPWKINRLQEYLWQREVSKGGIRIRNYLWDRYRSNNIIRLFHEYTGRWFY